MDNARLSPNGDKCRSVTKNWSCFLVKILDSEVTTGFPDWVESVLWVLAENEDIRGFANPDLHLESSFGKTENTKLCSDISCKPRKCPNKNCENSPNEHPWLLVVYGNGKQAIAACKTKTPFKNLLSTDLILHTPHTHKLKCSMLDKEARLMCNPELLQTVSYTALKASLKNRLTSNELPKELCNKERVSFIKSFIEVISRN
jgi:hypothetical protein